MSPLVNLNSSDDEPRGQVTEADLQRTIAESAAADLQPQGELPQITFFTSSGSKDFLTAERGDRRFWPMPLAPAEACTEVGADATTEPVMPREDLHALHGPFKRHPRLTTAVLLLFILLLLGLADHQAAPEDELELLADELAAMEQLP